MSELYAKMVIYRGSTHVAFVYAAVVDKVLDRFDSTGGGINYKQFCEMVMGSKSSDSTGVSSSAEPIPEKVLQRMIRESAKDLNGAFKHLDRQRRSGRISVRELRTVLNRYNVNLTDHQFEDLMNAVGTTDGKVGYMDFLGYFRKSEMEEVERETVGTIAGISVSAAIAIIRDKISQRMEGGPASLRRAFQFFDADGSGSISHQEFKDALKLKTMLVFEDSLLRKVMDQFDESGTGEITYNMFCEMVMDSKSSDSTSFGASSPVVQSMTAVANNIRESSRTLRNYCMQIDKAEVGHLSRAEMFTALQVRTPFAHLDPATDPRLYCCAESPAA